MSKARRFLEQVGPHRDALTAYCARLLWSPEDLEDALQETLVTAYRRFGGASWDGGRAWVLRIATWTCFRFNRRRRRARLTALTPEAAEGLAASAPELPAYEELLAASPAVFESFGDELARACRRLNENERAIFLLKTLGELSCREIAETLDVPLGTARGLLTRARHKLHAELVEFARRCGVPGAAAPRPFGPLGPHAKREARRSG